MDASAALDVSFRADTVAVRKEPLLVVDAEHEAAAARVMADVGDAVEDDLLSLVLLCAHPTLAPESASALSLRLVVGVSTRDLARLFLVPEPTMAARLTRARKRRPGPTSGSPRPPTCRTASRSSGRSPTSPSPRGMRRARARTSCAPTSPGMRCGWPGWSTTWCRTSRSPRRCSRSCCSSTHDGTRESTPKAAWCSCPTRTALGGGRTKIATALGLLAPLVESDLAGEARSYLLQALIAAEHATATTATDTDWARIAALYALLETHTGSPVVRLNRAVAMAAAAFDLAIARCDNEAEREHLSRRRQESLG